MEVEQLFETLTIKELKQQNIKTRTEIESKKEELRFLVGERYRDIIDAADTIFDMKVCSSEISDSLKSIGIICRTWNTSVSNSFSDKEIVKDKSTLELKLRYSVAAQIKLLLNMSELIWNALESSHFSEAAMLFNVCRNMAIHCQLANDKYKNIDFDMQIIFSRQWSSLQNLEETIGIVSRKYLKCTDSKRNFDNTLDCIVSIILLEDTRLEEVLQEYMHCVEHQIHEWFSSKSSTVQISVQLCSVASIITGTLSNVFELFIENRVLKRVEELSQILVQNMDCTKGERIYQYLPEQISKFKPALNSFQNNCNGIDHGIIIKLTNEWLLRYREKYQFNFTDSFSHLTTIKSVGETSHELKKIFMKSKHNNSVNESKWEQLEFENANEWGRIINDMYSKKLQIIIQQRISSSFGDWTDGIEKFISTNESLMFEDEFNEDLFFNYLWSESSKDVFFNSDTIPISNLQDSVQSESRIIFDSLYNHFSNYFDLGPLNSNKNCNFEALVVKSKVIRPEIYQIAKKFNDNLLNLIIEIIDTVDDCDEFLSTLLHDCLGSIVDKCSHWIENVGSIVDSVLPPSHEKVKKDNEFPYVKTESESYITSHQFRLIIFHQSIRSIYETLPAFQAGLMTSAVNSEFAKSISSSPKSSSKSKKSKNLRLPYLPGKKLQHQADYETLMWTVWNKSIESLKERVDRFVIWGITPSIDGLIGQYFEHIKSGWTSLDVCEYLSTKWTDMNLPHTESEGNVPISLEIPSQCTWLMHKLLINMSRLLTIFGGHSITRKNLNEIRLEILKSVIKNYDILMQSDELQENKTCQKQNIQLIFDLRFLLEIINAKTEIEKEVQDRLRSILSEIESLVDPFDYEMMNESLHQNLIQNVAKTSSLYLLLSPNPSKRNLATVQRIDTGANQHNLIDLVGVAGSKHTKSSIRFGILPISGYMVTNKSTASSPSTAADTTSTATVIPKPLPQPSVVNIEQHVIKSVSKATVTNTHGANGHSRSRNHYLGRLGSNWF